MDVECKPCEIIAALPSFSLHRIFQRLKRTLQRCLMLTTMREYLFIMVHYGKCLMFIKYVYMCVYIYIYIYIYICIYIYIYYIYIYIYAGQDGSALTV